MTTFSLTIEMDNDAFGEYPEEELQRLLSKARQQVGLGALAGDTGTLMDINGNSVGTWEVTDEVQDEPRLVPVTDEQGRVHFQPKA